MALSDVVAAEIQKINSWFVTSEAQVLQIIALIKAEEVVVATQVNTALTWVAQNAPQIAADINEVTSLIQLVGLTNVSAVATAVKDANLAVAALNAFAAANSAGQSNEQAVIQGYLAVKQAQAAVAIASVAAVQAPAPAKAA